MQLGARGILAFEYHAAIEFCRRPQRMHIPLEVLSG